MREIWRAFAKINLDLTVGAKRPDGYHSIQTVMQTIDLYDEIYVESAHSFRFTTSEGPADETNLVVRAAHAFEEATRTPVRLHLDLRKRIPSGAGLGGGSADAAMTLVGLDRAYPGALDRERLIALLGALGSDVPFFGIGGRALATGRGEVLFPIPDIGAPPGPEEWILLVMPRFTIATAEAYSWLDEDSGLTETPESITILGFCARFVPSLEGMARSATARRNQFEASVFRRRPELAVIREQLLLAGAGTAAMSGSGSTMFGVFESRERARQAAFRLDGDSETTIVRPVSRAEYWKRIVGV
jgi:4-diphosphocytidyl-2-C-methyl-D-erythritol kinase